MNPTFLEFVPPDQVEEIRRGFQDSERLLKLRLQSTLVAFLPVGTQKIVPALTASHMDIIRGHIESQLNAHKSSRGSSTPSKDRMCPERNIRDGRNDNIDQGASIPASKRPRMGNSPSRTVLPPPPHSNRPPALLGHRGGSSNIQASIDHNDGTIAGPSSVYMDGFDVSGDDLIDPNSIQPGGPYRQMFIFLWSMAL